MNKAGAVCVQSESVTHAYLEALHLVDHPFYIYIKKKHK